MGTRIVEAMIPVGTADGGNVSTEFCLLKAGLNSYNDGDQIVFDDESAASVMRRYKARGIDLMADYEHQSLVQPPIGPAPASAKRWIPEVRGGDLMATQIAWTDKAKSMLAAGEYRYFSIACRVDAKTNRCIELINFALTNLPAANGISALVAASRKFNDDEENDMSKTLIVALGLAADADETVALSAITRLREQHRELVALSGKPAHAEALGEIAAWKASHGEVVALRAELAEIKKSAAEAEFNTVLEQAGKDGKIPPAADDSRRVFAMSLRGKPDGLTMLKSYASSLPALVASTGEKKPIEAAPNSGDSKVVAFSRGELEMAKALTGNRPDKLLHDIAAWRAEGNVVKYGGFTETDEDKAEARRITVAKKG